MSVEAAAAVDYSLLKAHTLHLVGHLVYHSQDVADVARAEDAARPFFYSLWHSLEDARIENLVVRRLPGTARLFRSLAMAQIAPLTGKNMLPSSECQWGLYLRGREFDASWPTGQVGAMLDVVTPLIRAAAKARSADASLENMRAIYPYLEGLLLDEVRAGDRPEQAQTQAEEEWEAADENAPESELNLAEPTSGAKPPEKREEGGEALVVLGRHEVLDWPRPGTAPYFERGLAEKRVHPTACCSDRESIAVPPLGDSTAYVEARSQVWAEVGFLAQRLTRLLRERDYLRFLGNFRSGKVDSARLWRQRSQYYRLFKRRLQPGRRSVAFSVLVDESASMDRQDKCVPARLAAILCGEVLSRVDVPFEVIGYSTADAEAHCAFKLGLSPVSAYRHLRCARLQHILYKRFDESFARVKTRLLDIHPRHNNWDEEHLEFAYRRLSARPEGEKALIVISDGQPNGDAQNLERAVARLEREGCRIFAIGVGCDYVRRVYRRSVVVDTFPQLARELLAVIEAELMGRQAEPLCEEEAESPKPATVTAVVEVAATAPVDASPPDRPRRPTLSVEGMLHEGITAAMFRTLKGTNE